MSYARAKGSLSGADGDDISPSTFYWMRPACLLCSFYRKQYTCRRSPGDVWSNRQVSAAERFPRICLKMWFSCFPSAGALQLNQEPEAAVDTVSHPPLTFMASLILDLFSFSPPVSLSHTHARTHAHIVQETIRDIDYLVSVHINDVSVVWHVRETLVCQGLLFWITAPEMPIKSLAFQALLPWLRHHGYDSIATALLFPPCVLSAANAHTHTLSLLQMDILYIQMYRGRTFACMCTCTVGVNV